MGEGIHLQDLHLMLDDASGELVLMEFSEIDVEVGSG